MTEHVDSTYVNMTAIGLDITFGMYKEYTISSYVLLFMLLLMTSISLSHIIVKKFKFHYVSECGIVILVGLVAGAMCSVDQKEIVARWLVEYDPNVFFVGLLPPIIFNSGYTMKRRHFFENLSSILLFAILGTFASTILIGCFLYVLGQISLSIDMPLAECLTFGALISSTDPVSTLGVFEELHVDPKLFYIVFGESVLNDAISIVLFNTFSKFIGVTEIQSHAITYAVLDFVGICVGSILVGVLFGCVSSITFKYMTQFNLMHEVSMYVLLAYMPFLVAEVLELSGIVAILFAGMFMKHYTFNNLSPNAKDITSHFFHAVAFVCELVVFLNLGLTFFSMENGLSVPFMLWAVIACLLARAAHVYPLSMVRNACIRQHEKERCITRNEQHMIWFSGLRGAIAFSLSLSFPRPFREQVRAATMVVVVATVLIMGGLTVKALDLLKIRRLDGAEEVEDLNSMHRSVRRHLLLKWDAQYIMPWLTIMPPPIYDDVALQSITSAEISPNSMSEHQPNEEAIFPTENLKDTEIKLGHDVAE